jgi:predicted nucleic acid-binding protein
VRILLDTNVLLRVVEPDGSDYAMLRAVVRELTTRRHEICFASQSLVEFWNVCTRPVAKNGFGLTIGETDTRASIIEGEFLLLPDTGRVHAEWRRLVVAHCVCGVQVHDARLVASMLAHDVPQLLTLNDRDFKRYSEITALHPGDVVQVL